MEWGNGSNRGQWVFFVPVFDGDQFQYRKLNREPELTHEEKVALFEAYMVCKELEEMFKT